ncbi:MAG: LysM peptidoglycan-binding domain-containing protein [Alphaproteobacteria bacterium]|nr:LysM peptidoglycan-binding domain-containing protein [Alphaproteobacteria bacterium]
MTSSVLPIAGAVAIVTALAGCASVPVVSDADPYAKLAYVGAEQLYRHDVVAPLERPAQYVGAEGVPLRAVAYGGIDGAREAHSLYPREIAEKLDGRCEPYVEVAVGETLANMADLCDVDIAKLVAYNPGVADPYDVPIGLALKMPGADRLGAGVGLASLSGDLIGLYEIDRGENLSDVAARFDVSLTRMIDMNPEARWRSPSTGDLVRVPVGGSANGSVDAATAQWVGYSEVTGAGVADETDASTAFVEAHMPYGQRPVGSPDPKEASALGVGLWTSTSFVKAGGYVTVRLSGAKAGERVTFYRGKTTKDSDASVTVVAGANGVAEATFRTPTESSDLGGYVFRAVRQSSSTPYYSRRVGVAKL